MHKYVYCSQKFVILNHIVPSITLTHQRPFRTYFLNIFIYYCLNQSTKRALHPLKSQTTDVET